MNGQSKFDTAIEGLLVALLSFMPLAFGARHAWSEELVVILSGLIMMCFLLKLIVCRDSVFLWTWAYLPIALFLFVAVFQIIALPVDIVRYISPNTVALKTELLGDLPDAQNLLKSMTLGFYSNSTKHDLRLVFAIASVFVVVLNVFRSAERIKRLLAAITVIGGIIAIIALTQDMFGNGKIYWFIDVPGQAYSGPFINHSHYGQFMNLSIGAAIGLLIVKLRKDFAGKETTSSVVLEYFGSPVSKTMWLLIAVISLDVSTVFISLTRGGMISMLIAGLFTVILLGCRGSLKGHGWIMISMALAAFTCILYVGFDAVYNRFATFSIAEHYGWRLQILNDLKAVYKEFPIIGTGLGTYSVVYPLFSNINAHVLFTHAENEYAQLLGETGVIGLALFIVLGSIICAAYIKNIRNDNLTIRLAAYGLGFGIVAILIHSLSDYGQHVPANAILSAIFCALLLGLTRTGQNRIAAAQPRPRLLHAMSFFSVMVICIWSFVGANNARIAEANWTKALAIEKHLAANNWEGNESEYTDLISYAAAASKQQPENIEYRHWLNVYRLHSIARITNQELGVLVVAENLIPSVRTVANEFYKALPYCPTFGATWCVLGQIEKFILNDPAGSQKIKKGFRLAPSNPSTCFIAGCLDIAEGSSDESLEKFKKTVQLDGNLFGNITDIYINKINRPDLAIALAGENTDRLSHVANILENSPHDAITEQAKEKLEQLLEKKCLQSDVSPSVLASLSGIYRAQKNSESAIKCYRRILELDYGQVYWRYLLATALAETNKIPEAIHEAKICLRLNPGFKQASELIADLSTRKIMVTENNVSSKDF
ncbi:MAG: O-antigen ligase family protein [Sedimentisphaerales bacterium]|nr:O-antigen ligase family protein [Sedimentisphaerales bacterium]